MCLVMGVKCQAVIFSKLLAQNINTSIYFNDQISRSFVNNKQKQN